MRPSLPVTAAVLAALSAAGCGPRVAERPPAPPVLPTAHELREALEKAYRESSREQLREFLENWYRGVHPAEPDPSAADATLVFRAFYNPFELEIMGEKGTKDAYRGVSYVIVQTTLEIVDEGAGPGKSVMVKGFRPRLDLPGVKVLYLSEEYRTALEGFLGPDASGEESGKRLKFLSPQVKILRGHWGGWHLETHPEVDRMVFSEKGGRVAVHYRFGYGGSTSTFRKSGSGWVPVKGTGAGFWIE